MSGVILFFGAPVGVILARFMGEIEITVQKRNDTRYLPFTPLIFVVVTCLKKLEAK